MARYFYNWCRQRWPETSAVRVKETPKTCAEFRPLVYPGARAA
jgi:6-pyruvoyltetrahydropterin/6-carboxytetrahydropterin synthase